MIHYEDIFGQQNVNNVKFYILLEHTYHNNSLQSATVVGNIYYTITQARTFAYNYLQDVSDKYLTTHPKHANNESIQAVLDNHHNPIKFQLMIDSQLIEAISIQPMNMINKPIDISQMPALNNQPHKSQKEAFHEESRTNATND